MVARVRKPLSSQEHLLGIERKLEMQAESGETRDAKVYRTVAGVLMIAMLGIGVAQLLGVRF